MTSSIWPDVVIDSRLLPVPLRVQLLELATFPIYFPFIMVVLVVSLATGKYSEQAMGHEA